MQRHDSAPNLTDLAEHPARTQVRHSWMGSSETIRESLEEAAREDGVDTAIVITPEKLEEWQQLEGQSGQRTKAALELIQYCKQEGVSYNAIHLALIYNLPETLKVVIPKYTDILSYLNATGGEEDETPIELAKRLGRVEVLLDAVDKSSHDKQSLLSWLDTLFPELKHNHLHLIARYLCLHNFDHAVVSYYAEKRDLLRWERYFTRDSIGLTPMEIALSLPNRPGVNLGDANARLNNFEHVLNVLAGRAKEKARADAYIAKLKARAEKDTARPWDLSINHEQMEELLTKNLNACIRTDVITIERDAIQALNVWHYEGEVIDRIKALCNEFLPFDELERVAGLTQALREKRQARAAVDFKAPIKKIQKLVKQFIAKSAKLREEKLTALRYATLVCHLDRIEAAYAYYLKNDLTSVEAPDRWIRAVGMDLNPGFLHPEVAQSIIKRLQTEDETVGENTSHDVFHFADMFFKVQKGSERLEDMSGASSSSAAAPTPAYDEPPLDPGMEFLVHTLFNEMLSINGTAATRLLKIIDDDVSYIYQVSKGVEGVGMDIIYDFYPELFDKLNPRHNAAKTICEMIIRFEDTKFDNEQGQIRLNSDLEPAELASVGIDEDRAMIRAADKQPGGDTAMRVKNFRYVLPMMSEEIDAGYRHDFLKRICPELVVVRLLRQAQRKNAYYHRLLASGRFTEADLASANLPVRLVTGIETFLHERICLTRDLFKQYQDDLESSEAVPLLSFNRFLQHLDPLIYHFYQGMLAAAKGNPIVAFELIYKAHRGGFGLLKKYSIEAMLGNQSLSGGLTVEQWLEKEKRVPDMLEDTRDVPIELALKRFIEAIDFSNIPIDKELEILREISLIDGLLHIKLTGLKSDGDQLKHLLFNDGQRQPQLGTWQKIEFINCPNITSQDLESFRVLTSRKISMGLHIAPSFPIKSHPVVSARKTMAQPSEASASSSSAGTGMSFSPLNTSRSVSKCLYDDKDIDTVIRANLLTEGAGFHGYKCGYDYVLGEPNQHDCFGGKPDKGGWLVAVTPPIASFRELGGLSSIAPTHFMNKSDQAISATRLLLERALTFTTFKQFKQWYTSQQMNRQENQDLLKALFKSVTSVASWDNAKELLQIRLQKELLAYKDVFDELNPLLQDERYQQAKILFPINLSQIHWVSGEIIIRRAHHGFTVLLCAHDPMATSGFPRGLVTGFQRAIRRRLRADFPEAIIQIKTVASPYAARRQGPLDGTSCGVIVSDELPKLALGKSLARTRPHRVNAPDLRLHQIQLVKRQLEKKNPRRQDFLRKHRIDSSRVAKTVWAEALLAPSVEQSSVTTPVIFSDDVTLSRLFDKPTGEIAEHERQQVQRLEHLLAEDKALQRCYPQVAAICQHQYDLSRDKTWLMRLASIHKLAQRYHEVYRRLGDEDSTSTLSDEALVIDLAYLTQALALWQMSATSTALTSALSEVAVAHTTTLSVVDKETLAVEETALPTEEERASVSTLATADEAEPVSRPLTLDTLTIQRFGNHFREFYQLVKARVEFLQTPVHEWPERAIAQALIPKANEETWYSPVDIAFLIGLYAQCVLTDSETHLPMQGDGLYYIPHGEALTIPLDNMGNIEKSVMTRDAMIIAPQHNGPSPVDWLQRFDTELQLTTDGGADVFDLLASRLRQKKDFDIRILLPFYSEDLLWCLGELTLQQRGDQIEGHWLVHGADLVRSEDYTEDDEALTDSDAISSRELGVVPLSDCKRRWLDSFSKTLNQVIHQRLERLSRDELQAGAITMPYQWLSLTTVAEMAPRTHAFSNKPILSGTRILGLVFERLLDRETSYLSQLTPAAARQTHWLMVQRHGRPNDVRRVHYEASHTLRPILHRELLQPWWEKEEARQSFMALALWGVRHNERALLSLLFPESLADKAKRLKYEQRLEQHQQSCARILVLYLIQRQTQEWYHQYRVILQRLVAEYESLGGMLEPVDVVIAHELLLAETALLADSDALLERACRLANYQLTPAMRRTWLSHSKQVFSELSVYHHALLTVEDLKGFIRELQEYEGIALNHYEHLQERLASACNTIETLQRDMGKLFTAANHQRALTHYLKTQPKLGHLQSDKHLHAAFSPLLPLLADDAATWLKQWSQSPQMMLGQLGQSFIDEALAEHQLSQLDFWKARGLNLDSLTQQLHLLVLANRWDVLQVMVSHRRMYQIALEGISLVRGIVRQRRAANEAQREYIRSLLEEIGEAALEDFTIAVHEVEQGLTRCLEPLMTSHPQGRELLQDVFQYRWDLPAKEQLTGADLEEVVSRYERLLGSDTVHIPTVDEATAAYACPTQLGDLYYALSLQQTALQQFIKEQQALEDAVSLTVDREALLTLFKQALHKTSFKAHKARFAKESHASKSNQGVLFHLTRRKQTYSLEELTELLAAIQAHQQAMGEQLQMLTTASQSHKGLGAQRAYGEQLPPVFREDYLHFCALKQRMSAALVFTRNLPFYYPGTFAQVAKRLMQTEWPVDAYVSRQETLLHMAVRLGQQEICEGLLDYGASIDIKNGEGKTCLDMTDDKGNTLLHHMVRARRVDLALYLIHSRMERAVNISGVRYLQLTNQDEQSAVTITDSEGNTLLHQFFIYLRNGGGVGPSLSARKKWMDIQGHSWMLASYNRNFVQQLDTMLSLLLSAGARLDVQRAPINEGSDIGMTPYGLLLAMDSESEQHRRLQEHLLGEVTRFLLSYDGHNIPFRSVYGESAITFLRKEWEQSEQKEKGFWSRLKTLFSSKSEQEILEKRAIILAKLRQFNMASVCGSERFFVNEQRQARQHAETSAERQLSRTLVRLSKTESLQRRQRQAARASSSEDSPGRSRALIRHSEEGALIYHDLKTQSGEASPQVLRGHQRKQARQAGRVEGTQIREQTDAVILQQKLSKKRAEAGRKVAEAGREAAEAGREAAEADREAAEAGREAAEARVRELEALLAQRERGDGASASSSTGGDEGSEASSSSAQGSASSSYSHHP